ncbi:MAG TPA: hypothetical protein ENO22_03060 [candidate division Zixibacteria bacterium]|nr:hypothetical protein [candidate division Zixibacteria bacterium]
MRIRIQSLNWSLIALSGLAFIITGLMYCGGEEQAEQQAEGYLEETPVDTVVTATPLPNEVFIESNAFIPESLSVFSGTEVHWINFDDIPHTVTSGEGGVHDSIFASGVIEPNDTFSLQFLEDGIFPYYDSYRPDTLNGVVVVEEPPVQ